VSRKQPPKGERTETVTRKYDAEGELVSETVQTVVTLKPKDDGDASLPGAYL
jgi:hypothetical protein